MKKKTTTKRGNKKVKRSSSTSVKRRKSSVKKILRPHVVSRIPTPPQPIKIARSSAEINKPLIIGIITVALIAIIFFLAKSQFVGKAFYVVGEEPSVGFLSIQEDIGPNFEYYSTGHETSIKIMANLPNNEDGTPTETAGVRLVIDLGSLELADVNINEETGCSSSIISKLDWTDDFLRCDVHVGEGTSLEFEHATIDFNAAKSGEFEVVELKLKPVDKLDGEPEISPEYPLNIPFADIFELSDEAPDLIHPDPDLSATIQFTNDPDGDGVHGADDPCPYNLVGCEQPEPEVEPEVEPEPAPGPVDVLEVLGTKIKVIEWGKEGNIYRTKIVALEDVGLFVVYTALENSNDGTFLLEKRSISSMDEGEEIIIQTNSLGKPVDQKRVNAWDSPNPNIWTIHLDETLVITDFE